MLGAISLETEAEWQINACQMDFINILNELKLQQTKYATYLLE